MFVVIGFVIVIGGVVGGYLMAGGALGVLNEPSEFVVIGGAAIGSLLVSKLLTVGRAEGLRRITADIHFENYPMQRIAKKLGFRLHRDTEEMVVKADLDLYQPA